jgi:hypothetical protein
MTRRIVCWITKDPATIVAAKLAMRENDAPENGLPLVVVATGAPRAARPWFVSALQYLGAPVINLRPHEERFYRLRDDVHVIGVPVDEQGRYDAWMARWKGAPVLSVLADRALRREDCMTLARRAGLETETTWADLWAAA